MQRSKIDLGRDPTLAEALADPIVHAMMAADGIDAPKWRFCLRPWRERSDANQGVSKARSRAGWRFFESSSCSDFFV
jgi:hypothetical protein